ncbi:hypothetical protein SUDANB121_01645 [Nocardiopsis dassonvillei]|uniref:MFS transporter n=1 Tax=Nocardiopsis dassonvillei TaxID=2014 RepID=UPI003F57E124
MSPRNPPEPAPGPLPTAEVRDWHGRDHAVGPSCRSLTGAPRPLVLFRVLLAVAAVGVGQFGYGAAVPELARAHGLDPAVMLAPFVLWVLLQGGTAPLLSRLRGRGACPPSVAIPAGALLCAAGSLALGHADPLWAALGYGVLGGVGAGLVYHSAADLVAGWFPDRRVIRSAAVGGAFALGSLPLIPLVATAPPVLSHTAAALAAAVLGLVGGWGQRGAPPRWWPPGSDPRDHALRPRAEAASDRDLTVAQAWASGALPALHLIATLSGACALFTVAALPSLLLGHGREPAAAVAAVGAFALVSGLGRCGAELAAERWGRRRVLGAAMTVAAVGLFGLAWAVPAGPAALPVPAAALVGLGTGACYPLARSLSEDYFGSRAEPGVQGLVYSSKAVGGLLGVGCAVAVLWAAPTGGGGFWLLMALHAAVAAVLVAACLRRPLPVRTLPGSGGPWTA